MELLDAIKTRHSVRSFTDQKIEGQILEELRQCIAECNAQSGLRIQLCLDEPMAFSSTLAKYGKFRNVRNYLALVGAKGDDLEERCGYYGEKVMLKAVQLGLAGCWVGLTYSKKNNAVVLGDGEKLVLVIALGYGEKSGSTHKVKSVEQLSAVQGGGGEMPDWFRRGMEAAQLAPTAMNQQKFRFELDGDTVKARAGSGFYAKVDLGIAKCHFEIGAGDTGWRWA